MRWSRQGVQDTLRDVVCLKTLQTTYIKIMFISKWNATSHSNYQNHSPEDNCDKQLCEADFKSLSDKNVKTEQFYGP